MPRILAVVCLLLCACEQPTRVASPPGSAAGIQAAGIPSTGDTAPIVSPPQGSAHASAASPPAETWRVEMVGLPAPSPDALAQKVGSRVPTVPDVLRGFAAGLSRCVSLDPQMQVSPAGWAYQLRLTLGEQGEVLSVAPVTMGTLSSKASACVIERAELAQFPPRSESPVDVRFRVVRLP